MSSHEILKKDRRLSRRTPPNHRIRVTCRTGPWGLGPNVGLSVFDLSEIGIRLVVKEELKEGMELEVEVMGMNLLRPIKLVAKVVWCLPADDGTYYVGAQFQRRLKYADFSRLT